MKEIYGGLWNAIATLCAFSSEDGALLYKDCALLYYDVVLNFN